MGKGYLIDSNVLIQYTGDLLPENAYAFVSGVIDKQFNISVINKIEVLGHSTTGKEIEDFMDLANLIGLSNEVVNETIHVRKTYNTKLPDAIIAASALINKLAIVTRNTKDFDKIEGLEVVNPYDQKSPTL